jgi:hypothetical protein
MFPTALPVNRKQHLRDSIQNAMMKSNRAGPELEFSSEPAENVARAIVEAIEGNALEVIR